MAGCGDVDWSWTEWKVRQMIVHAVVGGVLGTLVMDAGNYVGYRAGFIQRVNLPLIGRLMSEWVRGRFTFVSPAAVPEIGRASLVGLAFHYSIGIVLSLLVVVGMHVMTGTLPGSGTAVVYGILTSVFALFLVYPAMGLGLAGVKAGTIVLWTCIINHILYGAGLAGGLMAARHLLH